MAASPWLVHDSAIEKINNGDIDLDADTTVMRLYLSSSNVHESDRADADTATSELSTLNGYTQGGQGVSLSVASAPGFSYVDVTNAAWSASGGAITARFAAVIDTTVTPPEIIATSLLDTTPDDVTAPDGTQFVISSPNSLYVVTRV